MNKAVQKARFGNCGRCRGFFMLDRDGLCHRCSVFVLDQLEKATRLTIKNPEITCEEVSGNLGISIELVNEWIRMGKIRCVALRYTCPTCKRIIVNQMICSYCGYTPELIPEKNDKPKVRSGLMESVIEERFSRKRKRTTRRLRLLSSLRGIHRIDPTGSKTSQ